MMRSNITWLQSTAFAAISVLSLSLMLPSVSLTYDAYAQGKGKGNGASAGKSNNGSSKGKSNTNSSSSGASKKSSASSGNGSSSNSKSKNTQLGNKSASSKKTNVNFNSSRKQNLNSQLKSLNSLKRNAEAFENSSDPKLRQVVVFLDNTEDREAVAVLIEQILGNLSIEQQNSDELGAAVEASAALLQETLNALSAAQDESALLELQRLEQAGELDAALAGLESTNAEILQTKSDLETSEADLQALRDAFGSLSPEDDGYAEAQAAIAAKEEEVGALQTQLTQQQNEADLAQGEIDSLNDSLANIGSSLDSLAGEIASYEQTSLQQAQDLELLELQQADQQALLDDLNTSLDNASDEFDRLEALTTDDVLVDALVAFLVNSGRSVDEGDITDEMLEWAKQQLAL
jgi:chromosome segregation ATPase